MSRAPFCLTLVLLFFGAALSARAGLAAYTDHGEIDFDTVMQLVNPYGTWAKVDGLWTFTPSDHEVPYTDGRWLYTDYGWFWKGSRPYSWATEHYGYWKRGDDAVWSWYPTPYWLAEIVEIRATSTHVGWRSAAVDDDGNFVEAPADRYAKTDEWTFVSNPQFVGPITPDLIVNPDAAAKLLDDSSASTHSYLTYREIDRPGPHPADFLALAGTGGMFAPRVFHQSFTAGIPSPTASTHAASPPVLPPPTPASVPLEGSAAPSGLAANLSASTNANVGVTGDQGPPADTRQVPYWTIMSLPTYWTPPPPDARVNGLYIYRPDFYQDQDGIERRIGLWLNPSSRSLVGTRLRDVLGASKVKASGPPTGPGTAATPVPDRDPFRGQFDAPDQPAPKSSAANQSSKGVPSGLRDEPPATNTAPATQNGPVPQ